MLTVKTDLHTHTIASMHAYGTVEENIRNAASMGMEAMGISDHFSGLFYPTTDWQWYGNFINYEDIPKEWYGVHFLKGVEADIVDMDGHLFGWNLQAPKWKRNPEKIMTYEDRIIFSKDYVIASVHNRDFAEGASLSACTDMYLKVLEHKKVLIIGHIIRGGIPFDLDTVLLAAKEKGKMIEINNASLDISEGIHSGCRKVAERCAELGVSVCVNSDAHCSYYVGRLDKAVSMLEEIHFPQELIGNRNLSSLEKFLEITK